jgi:hypothetical protein
MATKKIRYLVEKPGAVGAPTRYFWQPSAELRLLGFAPERIPSHWRELDDPVALEAAAIAAAGAKNAEVDAWRARGSAPLARSVPVIAEPKTVKALIAQYRAEGYPSVKNRLQPLAPKTVYEYKKLLPFIELQMGEELAAKVTPAGLLRVYEAVAAAPRAKRGEKAHPSGRRQAKAIIQVVQALFTFGRRKGDGWPALNPASQLGLAGSKATGILWPPEAVSAFVRMADILERPSIGTAVLVNEWLGQREADVLRFRRDILEEKGLVIRQNKTGAGVALPVAAVPVLVARIEEELARQAAHGVAGTRLILSEETGRPYEEDNFRHVFAQVRQALARETPRFAVDYLPAGKDTDDPQAFTIETGELRFMHLRHTALVRNVEAGASVPQAAAITGHKLATAAQIIDRYLIRTGAMAADVFRMRMEREGR